MSKRRRPKSVRDNPQSNGEATAAGRNGQQSTTPQGPIETVVTQGPTAMPAPVDADDQGRANSSSLPSAAVIGSTSEPERTSEHNTTSTQVSEEIMPGGLGGSAREAPSDQIVRGIRDVRLIKRLLHRPDWEMPANFQRTLPVDMYLIARNLRQSRTGGTEPADYSAHMRMKATEVLQRMEDANRRKLSLSVRLSQLERKTNVIEEHPEALGGGVQVNVYLPEVASMDKFDASKILEAEPHGNGKRLTA